MGGNADDPHDAPEQPDTTDEQGRPVDNPSGG